MKPMFAGVMLLIVVILFVLAAFLNFWFDHQSYSLSAIPPGHEVSEDADGPFSRSPALQIRMPLDRDRYLDWKTNQNLRRLGVIPALIGCGILLLLLRLYDKNGARHD